MRSIPGRSRKPRKDSRTKKVHGTNDDAGKWYRCWNCDFLCNEDRDDLGGAADKDGVVHTVQASTPYRVGIYTATLRSNTNTFAVVNPSQQAQNIHTPLSNSGCPFCGCRNWRGDY